MTTEDNVTVIVDSGPAGVTVHVNDVLICGPKGVTGRGGPLSFIVSRKKIAEALAEKEEP